MTPIPNGVRYEDRPLTATSPDGRITVEVGPSVTASITVESGSPDANGRLTAEVTISQSSSSVIGGQGGGSVKVSGRFEIGRASSTTYKVQVTNEELSQIATGQRPPPDPSDPDSLPVGGSILVTNDGFTDEKYGVAFKGISLESGTRETEGVSFGVERLDEDRVRVTTGPHQTVLDKLSVGVSTDIGGRRFSVRLSQHENLSTGRTQSVEIDVSTSEGRAAYEAFLRTGRLPAENGAVSNRQSIQRVRYEHGVGGTVGAGFVTVSGTLGDTSGTLTIQEGPEGTTYTYEGDSRPNNRIRARWTQRPDGTREWQEVSFSVANPRPGLIERLLGGSRPADSLLEQAGQPVGAESATLVITGDGFERLQEAARRRAQEIEEAGGTRLDPLTDALVRAQGRDEIVRALGSNGVLDQAPGRLAETLQHYGRLDPTLFQAGSGVAIAAQP